MARNKGTDQPLTGVDFHKGKKQLQEAQRKLAESNRRRAARAAKEKAARAKKKK